MFKSNNRSIIPKKSKSNRWFIRISAVFTIVAAIFAGQAYWESSLGYIYEAISSEYGDKFSVKQINVAGNVKLTAEEIIKLSNIHLGENLISVDVNHSRSLLESNGWIESASVSRVYPYTVNIAVEESSPHAIWYNNGFYLIGKGGKVIEQIPEPEQRPKYILVFGAEAASNYSKIYQQLFNSEVFPNVVALSNVRGRRWDIYLEDAILVKLPEINVDKALILLDNLQKNGIIKNNNVKELDMRLSPEKIFVKKK